ncbi:transcriptional regulator EutR [Pseudomonas sp. 34 E 7]|nr:transcriptional regulator EutR [Pseudomonas sp. 34 E 7]
MNNLLELAQIAGVPLHQSQQGLKTYTGMSPSQWLRLRRLNGSRRELLNSSSTTVAEVAMELVVRFSNSYRGLFKERPSETLKRAL